jgi:acyl-CoA reductase-like NAD-dependent aldehyde dehydrogenase
MSDSASRMSDSTSRMSDSTDRVTVRKTCKLYLGGSFPRSESGRTYAVHSADGGAFLGNASRASRKDARDAVVAARAAVPRWSGSTAYLRGQILYRIAEMMEARSGQLTAEVTAADGLTPEVAAAEVAATIDRWVYYAGWTDKLAQVVGATNPVAGPYFSFSLPEPTGVVAVLAPQRPTGGSTLLGLVSCLAPVIATGNTCVIVAARSAPIPAVTVAESLATADLPPGVVNLLTGDVAELGRPLAGHRDINGLDLTGVEDPALAVELERLAAHSLVRVRRPAEHPDWATEPGMDRMTNFVETKTIWHTIGM